MQGVSFKIVVVGSGYVGMSLAVLLAQHNQVTVLDIDHDRVNKINSRKSTVEDSEISNFLQKERLNLSATTDTKKAYQGSDFVVIATPTDFDEHTNKFDTSSVDSVAKAALQANSKCTVVIKSTIPIGHTSFLRKLYDTDRLIFSPEFLREGRALYDNLYPSRIIIGSKSVAGKTFANLLEKAARKKNIHKLFVGSKEAESIKLFSNTFLAMRVAFFNELDSFACVNELNTKSIIEGIGLDERIGNIYNNPSFGYGGYCLPKDTKQLLVNYEGVPQSLIKAVISSNEIRKDFIVDEIYKRSPKIVGFYGLAMKKGSDNFRFSATVEIIKKIKAKRIEVVIFESRINEASFLGCRVISNLDKFKDIVDIIIANRNEQCLKDVSNKVFTRDLFGNN